MRLLPVLSFIFAGCGATYSLTGTWDGDLDCDGAGLPLTLVLADTEDDNEAAGTGTTTFTSTEDEEVVLTWSLDASWGDASDGIVELTIDMDDCEANGQGTSTCGTMTGDWDVETDEVTGDITGFPVDAGGCSWTWDAEKGV